jgi:uncharacterized membrane protein
MRITHRAVMRFLMSAFYLAAGILHIVAPDGFLAIVPDVVPWPETTAGLMSRRLRRAAGIALAAYAIGVFPANIKHALFMIPLAGLPVGWWYHGPRLALQPVLVWWALYCGEAIDWPFGAKR